MGKACSSSLTRENSCSGPKTSNGLYVAAPPFYFAIRSEYGYSLQPILNITPTFGFKSHPTLHNRHKPNLQKPNAILQGSSTFSPELYIVPLNKGAIEFSEH